MKTLHLLMVGLAALVMTLFLARFCGGQPPVGAGGPPPPIPAAQLKVLGDLIERGALVHRNTREADQPISMIDFTNNPELRDDWLADLGVFPKLTGLGLAGTGVTDAGLEHLAALAGLETLTLNDTAITDSGLAKLARCRKLRVLDVRGTRSTAAALAELQTKLPEMKLATDVPAATLTETAKTEQTSAAPPKVSLNGGEKPLGRGVRPDTAAEGKRYTAKEIEALREKVRTVSQDGMDELPNGWTKGRRDVNQVVARFPTLKIREGYRLVAYVFREDGNGNGFVWALPVDAEFPAPADCPKLETHFLNPPKPFDALEPSEVIEGDGSPDSYLQASLLRRELGDYAASWHGLQWTAHTILDGIPAARNPADVDVDPLKQPSTPRNRWKWKEAAPPDMNPTVRFDGDRVTVTFFTFCPLEQERLFRYVDIYRRGKYRPIKVEDKIEIAVGEGGVMF